MYTIFMIENSLPTKSILFNTIFMMLKAVKRKVKMLFEKRQMEQEKHSNIKHFFERT